MAKSSRREQKQPPWLVRFLRGHWRLGSCAAVGFAVFAVLPAEGLPVPRFFFAWDAGVILYLGLIYWMIYRSSADHIRQQSALQDEGRRLVLTLASVAVIVSLTLIVQWLSATPDGTHAALGLVLVFLTIPLSWAFIQTIFALHYAHEYYAEHRGPGGGLHFPGDGKPDYWDFVYFAFGIGMAAQVADVTITAKRIRRIVTIHSILSFFFNVTSIALTVSIVSDAASNNR
jgi:uncharacterized membrane protein